MPSIYTGTGDAGFTSCNHSLVEKDSAIIESLGALDELQSSLDAARLFAKEDSSLIEKIQDKLRFLAGELSGYLPPNSFRITEKDRLETESLIDRFSSIIPPSFLRFSKVGSIALNEARVRTRRLERSLVPLLKEKKIRAEVYKYINRLSDLFFVLSYKHEVKRKN